MKTEKIRLNKYLAVCGICSRREGDRLIQSGMVHVNGVVVRDLGVSVTQGIDVVQFMNHIIKPSGKKVVIMLNKPQNTLVTVKDPQKRMTVMELISGCRERVFPVGRLDYKSQGLLLMTSDGELAQRLNSPKYNISKIYLVTVFGFPSQENLRILEHGILLQEGMTKPLQIKIYRRTRTGSMLKIVMHEGKKRQIRRMMDYIGHKVHKLERIQYGSIHLSKLEQGKWRYLTTQEKKKLYRIVKLYYNEL